MSDVIKQTIYGRVRGINTSDNMFNINIELADSTIMNLKTNVDLNIEQGFIYEFEIAKQSNSERLVAFLVNATKVSEMTDLEKVDYIYRTFDKSNPMDLESLKKEIESYLSKISNKVLYDITSGLIKDHYQDFFTYPAGQRLHHTYVGGLAYHTVGMLRQVDSFVSNYPYLNKDYLYSGVILHDLGKIIEFTGIEKIEYAIEGQLLGHLVIGDRFIYSKALELGYEKTEEVLLLEHMVISHHGQPNFGACKKPQTAEALVLWYIDTLDSKLRVLGEQLENTEVGSFTDTIGVLDKVKFYKHK